MDSRRRIDPRTDNWRRPEKYKKLKMLILTHGYTLTSTKPRSKMSRSDLCIPKININVKKTFIMETLQNANIGVIERMTELPLKQNPLYKRILFTILWNTSTNPMVEKWIERIKNNKNLKLVPHKSEPHYWMITQSCCPNSGK